MFTVYILKSGDGKIYKGMTGDVEKRFDDHRLGRVKTTRTMKNLKIIYTERYNTREEARKREVYLKTAAGRRFLKKILPM